MSRQFPIVHLLELVHGSRGSTVRQLARELGRGHPHALQKALARLYALKLLKRRRLAVTTGRPKFKYRLTGRGLNLLELLGRSDRRYTATWRDLVQLAPAVKVLTRLGSFKSFRKAIVPAWQLNRHFSA